MTQMNTEIDLRQYAGPARVSAQHAQALARGMEAVLPPDVSPEERAAMAQVVRAADAVQAVLLDREQGSAGRVRPAFLAFGTAWAVLGDALGNLARMPSELTSRGPRANEILANALPEGTQFVKLDAAAAWAAGARRLDHIDAEGLAPAIVELVGPDLLDAARKTTAALREATGCGPTALSSPSSTAVADAISSFSRLVGVYCRILSAKVDETDAASVERFRRAVAPLDAYRAGRRAGDDDDDLVVPPPVTGSGPTPAIAPGMPGASPFQTGPTS